MSSRNTFAAADSDNYEASQSRSPSSADQSSGPASTRPLILYTPPTIWSLVRGAAINVLLPFINGLMLGFGELFAHEAAYRLGWGGTKIFPGSRNARTIGPGVEVREDYMERRRRENSDLNDLTALE